MAWSRHATKASSSSVNARAASMYDVAHEGVEAATRTLVRDHLDSLHVVRPQASFGVATWDVEWAPTRRRLAINQRVAYYCTDAFVLTEGDAGVLPRQPDQRAYGSRVRRQRTKGSLHCPYIAPAHFSAPNAHIAGSGDDGRNA